MAPAKIKVIEKHSSFDVLTVLPIQKISTNEIQVETSTKNHLCHPD